MKYIVTSDIHFGHRNTPTKHIATNFIKYVLTEENSNADILFIAGDLFDRLIGVNEEPFLSSLKFLSHLLNYCHANNMMLRILEGTGSHDWRQPRIVDELNNIREEPINLKYIDILDIEYIPEFDKYVLYIPDEWSTDHLEVEQQIEEKLNEHGIRQVDMAMLHGQFQYQVAGVPYKGFYYEEEYFLKLVKGFINIGHYHTHTSFDRIIAQGSLDRLAHGQEEDKGYVVIEGDKWIFKKNPDAYIYKTIRLTKKETLNDLDTKILAYPEGSHIRLNMAKDHPFNINFAEMKLRYPKYFLTKKLGDPSDNDGITYILDDTDFSLDSFHVLSGSLKDTVREGITKRLTLTDSELARLDKHLEVFNTSDDNDED